MGQDPNRRRFDEVEIGTEFTYEGVRYQKMALVNRKIPSSQLWERGLRPPATIKKVNARRIDQGTYVLFAANDVVRI